MIASARQGHRTIGAAAVVWVIVGGALVARLAVFEAGSNLDDAALLASGARLDSWSDGPRAFALHASWTHLVSNLVLAGILGWLWLALGLVFSGGRSPHPARALGLIPLFCGAGALALWLAAQMSAEGRVGASAGAMALLGALLPAALRRPALRRRPLVLVGLPVLAVGVVVAGFGTGRADHLAHLLGLGLGAALGAFVDSPRGAVIGAAVTLVYFASALA